MGKGYLRKLGCGTLTLPMLWDWGGGVFPAQATESSKLGPFQIICLPWSAGKVIISGGPL